MFRTPALRDRAKYFIYLGIFGPTVTVRMTEEVMGGGGAHEYLMVIFGGLLLSCLLGVVPGLIMEWLMESKATAIVAWATGLSAAACVSASYSALTLVWDNAVHYPVWVQILCLGAVTLCVSAGVGCALRGTTVQSEPSPSKGRPTG
ncbi:hypothetical protein ACX80L_15945 [Arthrobacter sp. MDT1-48-3]